jgi:hypothetical protein
VTGAELCLCETDQRRRNLAHLHHPNGTILACGDWQMSTILAAEVYQAWLKTLTVTP